MQQQYQTPSVATLDDAIEIIDTIVTEEPDLLSLPCCSWSEHCLRVLTQIATQSPTHTDLRDQLAMHRTTLRRKLTRLEERQWIDTVPAENSYQLTTTGQIVVTGIARLLTQLQQAAHFETVQASVPIELPFEPHTIDRCEITHRHEHDPYAPTTAFLDLIRATDRFRGALPTIHPHQVDAFNSIVTAGDQVECLCVAPAFERLQSTCPAAFTTLREAPTARLFVCEEVQPFGVCRCDKTVVLLGYDASMTIHTLMTAPDSCTAVGEWITDHYETRKQAAILYEAT